MTTRKRNEFLDIESEDEAGDDRGYDSEAAEEMKGRATNAGGRASKRRRVSEDYGEEEDSHDEGDSGAGEDEDEPDEKATRKTSETKRTPDEDGDDNDHDDAHSITSHGASSTTSSKTKAKSKLAPSTKQKKNKTGVIYLSSLPPYLKPSALKSLLLARGFGPITKVFLTPAVAPTSSSVKKSNRRKTYSDGWVEFASKKTAKICAETLNANIVGGKKGGWYHDDVWNMKYLKGFKWADLMEQVQRERSEREAKRRIEDARARKEEKAFLAGVEKGKVVEGIRKKKEEKKAKAAENGGAQNDLQVRRVFRQNEVREKANREEGVLGEDTKRVLGKIF
ncbi:RNA-binding ATPase activator esf2 [Paecilomyces lecythidis]